jgi:hypothetical protein
MNIWIGLFFARSGLFQGKRSKRSCSAVGEQHAAIYDQERDRESDEVLIAARTIFHDWNCQPVDHNQGVAGQCEPSSDGQDSNHNLMSSTLSQFYLLVYLATTCALTVRCHPRYRSHIKNLCEALIDSRYTYTKNRQAAPK